MNKGSIAVMNWRNRTKEKLIEYKGGKCEKCGYDKIEYLRVFQFHHKDPSKKDFEISGKSLSLDRLKEEADKCILLCSNCHAEVHAEIDNEKKKLKLSTTHRLTPYGNICKIDNPKGYRSRKLKPCIKCGKDTINLKYCSVKCNGESISKRPPNEELILLKNSFSNIEIGRKLGVSEAAVRKWCKTL